MSKNIYNKKNRLKEINDYIDNKIVLVNNTADGFMLNQIGKQLNILEEHTGQEAVQWSEREKLLAVLN